MPYTEEPPGLVWINNVNPTSFGIITSQGLWIFGGVTFTVVAALMLRTPDGPSLTNGIPTSHEAIRQLGFALAGALLTAFTGKTIVGAVDSQQKRTADPRYKDVLEAKERGKIAGAAAAVVIADKAKDMQAARDAGVLTDGASAQADLMRAARASMAVPTIPDAPPKNPTEPDLYTDDERGGSP